MFRLVIYVYIFIYHIIIYHLHLSWYKQGPHNANVVRPFCSQTLFVVHFASASFTTLLWFSQLSEQQNLKGCSFLSFTSQPCFLCSDLCQWNHFLLWYLSFCKPWRNVFSLAINCFRHFLRTPSVTNARFLIFHSFQCFTLSIATRLSSFPFSIPLCLLDCRFSVLRSSLSPIFVDYWLFYLYVCVIYCSYNPAFFEPRKCCCRFRKIFILFR